MTTGRATETGDLAGVPTRPEPRRDRRAHSRLFSLAGSAAAALGLALSGVVLTATAATPAFGGAFPGSNGPIVFESFRNNGQPDIWKTDATGSAAVALTANQGDNEYPAISSDSSQVAFATDRDAGNFQIYKMNIDGSGQTRLSNNTCTEIQPSWSPDSTKIAFVSSCSGHSQILVMNADGTGRTTLSQLAGVNDSQPAWSPDGTKIAFTSDRTGKDQIFVMSAADGSGAVNLSNNTFSDSKPNWKPDGSELAFQTDRLGSSQIWQMNGDGTGQAALVTPSPSGKSDTNPAWSPDGTQVAFSRSVPGNSLDIFAMVINVSNGHMTDVTNNPAFDDEADWGPGQNALVPEVPLAVGLPLAGFGVLGLGFVVQRRRRLSVA
jgi:Tol biopolymer transport system component